MESKNNNKSLVTIIIILTIIILSLIAYLFYSKIDTPKENLHNNTITNNNEQIQNNNKNESQETNTIATVFEKFYGKWEYLYEYEDPKGCKDFHNLELKKDGTYTYSGGSNCANTEEAKGNYAISQNKIYLYNDNCNITLMGDECGYPNCSKILELEYTEKNEEFFISSGTAKLDKK